MKSRLTKSLLTVAMANIFAIGAVHATNGYFSEGTGAKNRGLGGAGTALAQETGSIVMNPAAAVNMGERIDIGVGLFNPSPRGYTISGNNCTGLPTPCGADLDGAQDSTMDYFVIPFYGQTFSIDNESSWAFTVSALGGMNTDYETNPFQSFSPTPLGAMGIDLKQVSIGGTYARKINSQLSLGATIALVMQQFQAKGLGAFASISFDTTGATLTNAGKSRSTGIGLNFGATYDAGQGVTVAFAYAPKVNMAEFDEYAGLFAEGGDFDIPSNYTLGLAWEASSDVLVSVDYRRINYTDVASVSNDSQRATDICGAARAGLITQNATTEATCLGGSNGAGFGWSDMNIIKVGVAWDQDKDTTYRAGWNYGASPVKAEDTTFNVIAPAVVENHLSLGMTTRLDAATEITVDFIHSFNNSVSGPLPAAFGGVTTEISMEQNFIEVQYGKRF